MSTTVGDAGAKPAAASTAAKPLGMRKNGKQWHAPKKAFRPGSGLTSYAKRAQDRVARIAVKAKEKEMKDEKEAERQVSATNNPPESQAGVADNTLGVQERITKLKEKRAAKEEKERYEKLAEKMHKKRVERLKRKEKRNKLLNS